MQFLRLALALAAIGTVTPAQSDPIENVVLDNDSDYSAWIQTVANGLDREFRVVPGARLVRHADGTADLTLETANAVDPTMRLVFDVDLGGHVAPGSTPPPGSPRLSQVAVNAGVDPGTWSYYTTLTGTITGAGSLQGFSADISRMGEALQIGPGANLVDTSVGLATWFHIHNVVQGPSQQLQLEQLRGDLNLTLATETTQDCVENLTGSNRVLWLDLDTNAPNTPGSNCVGTTKLWRVLDGASMTEYPDGTARVLMAAVSRNDPDLRLSVEVELGGYVPPGGPAPGGSPRVNGRITRAGIDPSLWHYYTTLDGTIRGRADLAGFEATISRRGEALQVGQGANLMDLSYGFASWFDIQIVSQNPNAMLCFRRLHGDFNGSLGDNCVCIGGKPATSWNYGTGVAGCAGVPSYTLGEDPLTGRPLVLRLGNANSVPVVGTALFSDADNDLFIDVLGGTILVGLPTLASANYMIPPGGLEVVCSVPASPCAVGLEIFTQVVCSESCAPSGFSLSQGLRLCIGDL